MTANEALQWADKNCQPESVERLRSRAAVAALADEVRRLQLLAMCDCGDKFTEHDHGTCGNCLAGMDRTTEVERMREIIERLRGMLQTCAGWFLDLDRVDLHERCMEAAFCSEVNDGDSRVA